MDADVLRVGEVAEVGGGEGEADAADDDQRQMPKIDVADPLEDAGDAALEALALEHAAIGQHGGEPGKQHENLGSVRKSEVPQGELGENVVGHVVDENEKQRQTAKEINSQVAL